MVSSIRSVKKQKEKQEASKMRITWPSFVLLPVVLLPIVVTQGTCFETIDDDSV